MAINRIFIIFIMLFQAGAFLSRHSRRGWAAAFRPPSFSVHGKALFSTLPTEVKGKGTYADDGEATPSSGRNSEVSILSWNVNGLRSYLKHDPALRVMRGLVDKHRPDFICLQETKLQEHHTEDVERALIDGLGCRSIVWSSSRSRKGYSGTAVVSMHTDLSATAEASFDIGVTEMDSEGRVICLKTKDFALLNVYSPNSGATLARLADRVKLWDVALRARMESISSPTSAAKHPTGSETAVLKSNKSSSALFPVIVAGDLNVAHERIDFYQSGTACLKQAGLTPEERESFGSTILKDDFIDTYRHIYPSERRYSYFSARQKPSSHSMRRGLRIDYVLTNAGAGSICKERPPFIEDEIWLPYSDHSPIGATFVIPPAE